ncbi:MAG TPA: hypothetical protein VGJ26_06875 [Pirellulales bacterium]|jgi:hypothetical protein
MARTFGPWSSGLAWQAMRLSSFWRRRLTMLPLTAARETRRSRGWSLTVVALAAAVFFSPTLYLSGAPADDGKTETDAASEKEDKSAGAPVRVELPGGDVYEFIGVAEHPSRGGPWWGADGALIAAPYDKHPSTVSETPPKLLREFAVRLVKKADDGDGAFWNVLPNGSSGSGEPLDAKGKKIKDIQSLAQALPLGAKTCTIRFETAAGPWQTLAETDGQSAWSMGNQKYSFGFAPAAERDGKLAISIAHNVLEQDMRIVAIDLEGKEITTGDTTSVGGRGFMQTTSAFAGLAAKNVKEFRLQSRTYQAVEIQNISLHPEVKTTPKVAPVKDPQKRY